MEQKRFPQRLGFSVSMFSLLLFILLGSLASASASNVAPAPAADRSQPVAITEFTSPALLMAQEVTVTLQDALVDDLNSNNLYDNGDTIEYTAVLTTDTTAQTNAILSIPLDANSTLSQTNGLNFKSTPIARNESYNSIGNVGINVPVGNGVLANDSDPDGSGSVTVVAFDSLSSNGGNIAIQADGSFTYMPAPGFEGVDTFSYTIEDVDGNQDTAVVTVTVANVIWFIDNSAVSQGDGRLTSPYNSLSGGFNNNPNDEDGDTIFIYSGSGSYDGGLTIRDQQTIIGQGATNSITAILNITPPQFTNILPTTNGANPTIINTGGRGINLKLDNRIIGVTVGETSNVAVNGSGVGDLTFTESSIIGSNKALNIVSGGNMLINLEQLTVTNATNGGVQVQNVSGDVTIANLNVTTTGGTAVSFNGAGSVSIVGTGNSINASNGVAIDIRDTTIKSTGITLNSLSAQNGNGGIVLDNTGTVGFFIAGSEAGGFGAGGTIQNISGDAVYLEDTQNIVLRRLIIGDSSVSIGDGITANVNIQGDIIQATNVTNLGLDTVKATRARDFGILGERVNGLTIYNSHFLDIGNADSDVGSRPRDVFSFMRPNGEADIGALSGEVFIVNSTIDAFRHRALTALVEGGTTLDATISNVTVSNNSTGYGSDAFYFNSDESGTTVTAVINNSTFTDVAGHAVYGRADFFSNLNVSLTNSNVTGNATDRGGAFTVISNSASNGTYAVMGNIFTNLALTDLYRLTDEGTLIGTYDDNVVNTSNTTIDALTIEIDGNESINLGVPADPNFTMVLSNSTFNGYNDIFYAFFRDGGGELNLTMSTNTFGATDAPTGNIIDIIAGSSSSSDPSYGNVYMFVEDNNIVSTLSRAFDLRTRDDDGVAPHAQDVGIHATIVNNQIAASNDALYFRHQHNSATNVSCLDMSNNSGDGAGGTAVTGNIDLEQTASGTFNVVQASELALEQANPSSATPATANTTGTVNYGAVASCTLPDLPPAPNATANASQMAKIRIASYVESSDDEQSATLSIPHNPYTVEQTQTEPSSNAASSGETIVANLGSLDPNQTVTITFYAKIDTELAIDVAEFCAQATLSANGMSDVLSDDPDTVAANDETCGERAHADVDLTLIVQNESGDFGSAVTANINETITYTLTLTNAGPDNLSAGTVVTELLPDDVTLVSFSVSEGTTGPTDQQTLRWTLADMAVSESQTATIVATVNGSPSASALTLTANVSDAVQHDSDEINNATNATVNLAGADLSVDVSASNALPEVGETMLYTVTITNLGADSANGVVVDYTFPATLDYAGVDSISSGSYDANTGKWTLNDDEFEKDESHTLVLSGTVPETAVNQTINSTATVSNSAVADFVSSNNSASTSINVQSSENKVFLPFVVK